MSDDPIRDAIVVERFLNDEVIRTAFEVVRESYHRRWAAAESPMDRNEAWHLQRALSDVEKQLRVVVERGAVANAKLLREQRAAGRPGA